MMPRTLRYLEKLIKYGYNHVDFDEKLVKSRRDLIFRELILIKNLPPRLKHVNRAKIVAYELAEAAICVQGFAIKTLKIYPSNNEFLISSERSTETKELFKIMNDPGIHWKPTDQFELRNSISILQTQIKRRRITPQLEIRMGNETLFIPKDIDDELTVHVLDCLKRYNQKKWEHAVKYRKEFKSILFDWVGNIVYNFIKHVSLESEDDNDDDVKTTASLITAIVLMASGYLVTRNDYMNMPKKPVKDYRNRKPRYYTYHEFLRKQFKHTQSKANSKTDLFYSSMFK